MSEQSGPLGRSVLVVEDELGLAEEIQRELETSGHAVELATTAEGGLKAARNPNTGALVLDRMLNGDDGLSIITALRDEGSAIPALIISGLSSVDDRIAGLKAGGDDYLVKPFEIRELSARVEALLRRGGDPRATKLQAGPLAMDLVERRVHRDGRPIDLLPREFRLLEYFMRRPNQVVTRAMLLEDVWNYKFLPQTNVVDVHIGNLRRKLDGGDSKKLIVNVRAAGFRLQV